MLNSTNQLKWAFRILLGTLLGLLIVSLLVAIF